MNDNAVVGRDHDVAAVIGIDADVVGMDGLLGVGELEVDQSGEVEGGGGHEAYLAPVGQTQVRFEVSLAVQDSPDDGLASHLHGDDLGRARMRRFRTFEQMMGGCGCRRKTK